MRTLPSFPLRGLGATISAVVVHGRALSALQFTPIGGDVSPLTVVFGPTGAPSRILQDTAGNILEHPVVVYGVVSGSTIDDLSLTPRYENPRGYVLQGRWYPINVVSLDGLVFPSIRYT